MKSAILLAVAFVSLSSLPFVSRQSDAAAREDAQAPGAQVNPSTATNVQAHPGTVQANASASADAQVQPGHAELVGKFDPRPFTVAAKTKKKSKPPMKTSRGENSASQAPTVPER